MWLRRVSGYQQLLFLHILWEIYNPNPDIYYISYNQFALYATQINLKDKYLTPNPVDSYALTTARNRQGS